MDMTPEDRLNRIEATLDRAAQMYEKMGVRQVGIRTIYRQGADRIAELANRIQELVDHEEHQDALLDALLASQMRLEEQTQRSLQELAASQAASQKEQAASQKEMATSQKELATSQKELAASQKKTEEMLQAFLRSQGANGKRQGPSQT